MADLAAAGAAAGLRLAYGVGREVILVHIALEFFFIDAVEHLLIAHRAERRNGENLRLAAGEHTGAVYARQEVDFGGQRADLVHLTAVYALLLVEQPAAYHVFLGLVKALVDLGLAVRVNLVEVLVYFFVDGLQALVADGLVVGVEGDLDVLNGEFLDGLEHLLVRLVARIAEFLLADLRLDALDELDDLLVGLVARHDAVVHILVADLVRARLDHGDAGIGGCDGDGHLGNLALFSGGVDDELAVDQADGDAGDRAVPRDIGDGQRDRGADHRGDFRGAVMVDGHHGADDGNVVAHILREQRADRAVDHAGGKDRLIGRAALTLEVGAGDLAHGVELFLKIDGEREEIHALAGLGGCGSGHMDHRLAVADKAGAVGKLRHFAGFHFQGTSGQFGFKNPVIFKHSCSSIRFPRRFSGETSLAIKPASPPGGFVSLLNLIFSLEGPFCEAKTGRRPCAAACLKKGNYLRMPSFAMIAR